MRVAGATNDVLRLAAVDRAQSQSVPLPGVQQLLASFVEAGWPKQGAHLLGPVLLDLHVKVVVAVGQVRARLVLRPVVCRVQHALHISHVMCCKCQACAVQPDQSSAASLI